MSTQRWTWWRGQAMALVGLMVVVVLGVGSFVGAMLAQAVGFASTPGSLAGAIAGYFASRALLRTVTPRVLPPSGRGQAPAVP